MKVVVIEERIFNQFLMLVDDLILRIERTAGNDSNKQVVKWLDTQDVFAYQYSSSDPVMLKESSIS